LAQTVRIAKANLPRLYWNPHRFRQAVEKAVLFVVIPAPSTANVTRLSDVAIGTLILNTHKAGSMFGMLWANECVDPDVRSLHVMSANNCQQIAYEVWQFMNSRGYYEVPSMPVNDIRSMSQSILTSVVPLSLVLQVLPHNLQRRSPPSLRWAALLLKAFKKQSNRVGKDFA
jgi:hypothetical protein